MTVTDLFPVEEELDLSILAERVDDFLDAVSERDLATWAEHRRQFVNEDFHREWYDLVERESRLCIVAPRDHAKALALDTPVAVPGGWRPIGEISVGDTVLGRFGAPDRVTAVSRVYRDNPCYRVGLSDGSKFVADAGHQWFTYHGTKAEAVTTTVDMRGNFFHHAGYHVIPAVTLSEPHPGRSYSSGRSVLSVEPVDAVPVKCISTESGGYLIGDRFVLTHNSECITINQAVWRCTHNPGFWVYVFAATRPQAEKLMARIKGAMRETSPYLLYNAISDNKWDVTFSNEARVTVGGIGQSVRTVHPDLIIGDDVLGEKNSLTYLQRKRVERYWLGDVSGMCHPGTIRALRSGERIEYRPTRIHLVGTPFHSSDLLMGLKKNPIYKWRRYSAEFNPDALPIRGSLAVEAS